jgi:hypothetical protein
MIARWQPRDFVCFTSAADFPSNVISHVGEIPSDATAPVSEILSGWRRS